VEEFKDQVKKHRDRMYSVFGVRPKTFRNTELIYSDDISEVLYDMGIKNVLTEGAKHILGWKSPNYVYASAVRPEVKLLVRNNVLCNDLINRFSDHAWSEFPLTADKFISWVNKTPPNEQVINLFMNYEMLGSIHAADSGIFDFFKALPHFAAQNNISFSTPSEVFRDHPPVDTLSIPYPISWVGEEKDCSSWLGNALQQEAFRQINKISERVRLCEDRRIRQDWTYLQSCDHLHYMTTKHNPFSPYDNPYDAFNNYMNVFSDFILRVEAQFPASIENEELNSLLTTIRNQAKEIRTLEKQLGVKKTKANKKQINNEP
jgi:alpha-amylase